MEEELVSRTLGCTLPDHVAKQLFTDFVAKSSCSPSKLWSIDIKSGRTSDWNAIAKHAAFLSQIIERGKGRIPKQFQMHKQFVEYLESEDEKWKFKDSDAAIGRLRCMLQTLLHRKGSGAGAPKRHPQLGIIIDKLIIDKIRGTAEPDEDFQMVVLEKPVPPLVVLDADSSDDDIDFQKLFKKLPPTPTTPSPSTASFFAGFSCMPLNLPAITNGLACTPPKLPALTLECTPPPAGVAKKILTAAALAALAIAPPVPAPTPSDYLKLNATLKEEAKTKRRLGSKTTGALVPIAEQPAEPAILAEPTAEGYKKKKKKKNFPRV
jgi:hypothetical protein